MKIQINAVDKGGNVTDTRTETFSYALSIASKYTEQSETSVKLFNENNLNEGWMTDVTGWQGNVTTYDFKPIIE